MKLTIATWLTLPLAYAHTHITNMFVNGVDQGDLMCLRYPANSSVFTWPVEDLDSPDVACGLQGTTPVERACPVADGATLTFQYRKMPEDPSEGTLDPSHVGPCAVYMKKVENAVYDGAAGDGWFKIWDQGYDNDWCTINMINDGGLLTVNLPLGLEGGYYLVRPELLALHNANKGDPQYYITCAQIFLQSSGTLVPQDTVGIPGYVSKDDTADSWNIYNGTPPSDYVPPGPEPVQLISSGFPDTSQMTSGMKPEGCVLEVGSNWCGIEVPDYDDETSCWASVANCWSQNDQCWKLASGAMNSNCNIWIAKCHDLQDQCNNKNFNGPPDKGKDLTLPKSTIQPPPPLGPTRGSSDVDRNPYPTKV